MLHFDQSDDLSRKIWSGIKIVHPDQFFCEQVINFGPSMESWSGPGLYLRRISIHTCPPSMIMMVNVKKNSDGGEAVKAESFEKTSGLEEKQIEMLPFTCERRQIKIKARQKVDIY